MAGILRTTKVICADIEGRVKVSWPHDLFCTFLQIPQILAALQRAADYILASEPGVAQFLVALTLEDTSQDGIYVIEEYIRLVLSMETY